MTKKRIMILMFISIVERCVTRRISVNIGREKCHKLLLLACRRALVKSMRSRHYAMLCNITGQNLSTVTISQVLLALKKFRQMVAVKYFRISI